MYFGVQQGICGLKKRVNVCFLQKQGEALYCMLSRVDMNPEKSL